MENLLGMILNAENGRMLAIVVLGYLGYMRIIGQMKDMGHSSEKKMDALDRKIDGVESSLNRRIDGLESLLDRKIDEKLIAFHALLKANDFAHLNHTIEALTFTLERMVFSKGKTKNTLTLGLIGR